MKNFITNRQFFFMLYCIIVGYGANIPKIVTETAGTGGWISVAIATLIFIFITYIITYLQYVYENKTLYEYSNYLVGKVITYIFIVICIIYFFVFFTIINRQCCETIQLTVFNKTPVIYLTLLFYIVICYALIKGINCIARLCEIYGVLSIINYLFVNIILFTQGKIVNLRPIFVPGDIMTYLKGTTKLLLPFLGAEALLFLPVSKKNNKGIFKYTILTMAFVGAFYIFIVEANISVVGIDEIVNSTAPLFIVLKGIDAPYLEFFRRIDGIYMIFWIMSVVCAECLWGYGTITFLNKIFKNANYNFLIIIVTIISFIIAQIPKKMEQLDLILKLNSYLGILVVFIIPIILLLITKVKKCDKKI